MHNNCTTTTVLYYGCTVDCVVRARLVQGLLITSPCYPYITHSASNITGLQPNPALLACNQPSITGMVLAASRALLCPIPYIYQVGWWLSSLPALIAPSRRSPQYMHVCSVCYSYKRHEPVIPFCKQGCYIYLPRNIWYTELMTDYSYAYLSRQLESKLQW